MATCPVCAAEIADDFGLVTCAKCGSQVMVGIDGGSDSGVREGTSSKLTVSENSAREELSNLLVGEISSPNISSVAAAEVAGIGYEAIAQEPFASSPTPTPSTPDMGEIADFGNAEISQGDEGLLRFRIHIRGVDTSDMRTELKSVLADGRFLWDVDGLMRSIRQGQLQLTDVTAVKASLLVQRLRHLPLEIHWEQYAITNG